VAKGVTFLFTVDLVPYRVESAAQPLRAAQVGDAVIDPHHGRSDEKANHERPEESDPLSTRIMVARKEEEPALRPPEAAPRAMPSIRGKGNTCHRR
jgi:hypothetical protein